MMRIERDHINGKWSFSIEEGVSWAITWALCIVICTGSGRFYHATRAGNVAY